MAQKIFHLRPVLERPGRFGVPAVLGRDVERHEAQQKQLIALGVRPCPVPDDGRKHPYWPAACPVCAQSR